MNSFASSIFSHDLETAWALRMRSTLKDIRRETFRRVLQAG